MNDSKEKLGYYTDRRNGDLWHLSEGGWSWVNGNNWNHVPREYLDWSCEPNPFRRVARLKCPSCGELMGEGTPYVAYSNLTAPEERAEFGSGDLVPELVQNLPMSGHKYVCESCHCEIDIPVLSPERGE